MSISHNDLIHDPSENPASPDNTVRAHDLAPDPAPCPAWCAVDWHADLRLWEPEYNDAGRGLSGRRTCIGAVSSVPMQREVNGQLVDRPPVVVSVERWQSFDLAELGKGYPVQSIVLPGVRVVSIHADEDTLYPPSVLALGVAMVNAYAALAPATEGEAAA